MLGTALTAFALPTLAVLVLHASTFQLGLLSALQRLAFPILGLLIGVLVDRYSRRTIMIAADFVRFGVLGSIPILAALHSLDMSVLFGAALLSGIAAVFFDLSYVSYLPVVVTTDRLSEGNAKLEFSNSGASISGNALAGGLIQWIGAAATILIDAISYLVSAVSLITITAKEPPHVPPRFSIQQVTQDIRHGLRVVFSSSDLRSIMLATGVYNIGSGMITAVSLIYAYRTLSLQPALLGLVYGLANLGFVGALLAARVRRWLGLKTTLMITLLASGVASGGLLLAQLGAPYLFLYLSSLITAVSIPIYGVNAVSYRQGFVDPRLQGRVTGVMRVFAWGTFPLGSLLGGFTGTLAGVQSTIAIGAVFSGLSALGLMFFHEREPQPSQDDTGGTT